MKKSLLAAASLALVLGLASCGGKTTTPAGGDDTTPTTPAGEVEVPTEEGKVTFYFTMGEGSVEVPEYADIYLTGKLTNWETASDKVVTMKQLNDSNIYYGTFAVAEDLEDFGYQLTMGYSADSGAPATGVNWSFKSAECQAASGESGTENATYTIVDGKADLGTHTWTAAPGPVVMATDFDVQITVAEALPEYVSLYMPGNLRNNWACNPELDRMTPSADRKTWTIHVDAAVVNTYDVKVIAEYTECTGFSWGTTVLDDGAGNNYALMVLRSATGSVININEEENVAAYPVDLTKFVDPATQKEVEATIELTVSETALPEGVLGIAIKGSFDSWTPHAFEIENLATGMKLTYKYTVLTGSYEFGYLSYDNAETFNQVTWYPKTNITVEVTETATFAFTGSLAEGVTPVAA